MPPPSSGPKTWWVGVMHTCPPIAASPPGPLWDNQPQKLDTSKNLRHHLLISSQPQSNCHPGLLTQPCKSIPSSPALSPCPDPDHHLSPGPVALAALQPLIPLGAASRTCHSTLGLRALPCSPPHCILAFKGHPEVDTRTSGSLLHQSPVLSSQRSLVSTSPDTSWPCSCFSLYFLSTQPSRHSSKVSHF